MMSTACSEGRHQGTPTPEPGPPTLDHDNRGRLIGDWSQPPCTGRATLFDDPRFSTTRCTCPCHQADTKTT